MSEVSRGVDVDRGVAVDTVVSVSLPRFCAVSRENKREKKTRRRRHAIRRNWDWDHRAK